MQKKPSFMGGFHIALIVAQFEETAEKGMYKKPSLRGGFHIALIVAFLRGQQKKKSEQTQFEVESFIAVIVVQFEEIAEKDLQKKPSLRGGLHIALIVVFLRGQQKKKSE